MRTQEGIAVTAIAPVKVETIINGKKVSCELRTNYPFEDGYQVVVCAEEPVRFALDLRIPGFAQNAQADGAAAEPGKSFRIERLWEGSTEVTVTLSFQAEYVSRPSGLFCVRRGPLVYSLPVKEQWNRD